MRAQLVDSLFADLLQVVRFLRVYLVRVRHMSVYFGTVSNVALHFRTFGIWDAEGAWSKFVFLSSEISIALARFYTEIKINPVIKNFPATSSTTQLIDVLVKVTM